MGEKKDWFKGEKGSSSRTGLNQKQFPIQQRKKIEKGVFREYPLSEEEF